MSNVENLLKSLLGFMKTGQQLPSKEAMRMTCLTVLMSLQLQLSLNHTSQCVDSSVNNYTKYMSQIVVSPFQLMEKVISYMLIIIVVYFGSEICLFRTEK